jgi:tetratricopeptide (TPR) repeat protein
MDSKERHELRTNELADWLGHIPDLLHKYRNQLVGLALIVIGLISWPILNRWRQQSDFAINAEISKVLGSLEVNKALAIRQQQDSQQEFMADAFLVASNNLAEEAKKAPSEDLSAIALIKRGQALRMDLIYRKDVITEDVSAAQIKQAQEAYQQAFDKAKMPAVKAMAQLGLGLCTEESGLLDEARNIYQKIADEPSYAGTPLPKAAKDRIANMDDNNKKFVFADTPKNTSVPANFSEVMPSAASAETVAPAQIAPVQPAAEEPQKN